MEKLMTKPSPVLDGNKLRVIIEKFSEAWVEKLKGQSEVMTFHDHRIKQGVDLFLLNYDAIPWDDGIEAIFKKIEYFAPRKEIERFVSHVYHWYQGRYVNYADRNNYEEKELKFLRNADQDATFSMSQGRFGCLKWKDTLLFKTVYDLAIYQMLMWEQKPRTIIEIGAGSGGSAIWMSDLIDAYDLDCEIVSLDITPPDMTYKHTVFLQGDCNEIEKTLTPEMLKELKHPWLIIEDAHVNVLGVLNYLHKFVESGDYFIVEDSGSKQEAISQFIKQQKDCYKLDTEYCDFFGQNVSCSYDSIFKRT